MIKSIILAILATLAPDKVEPPKCTTAQPTEYFCCGSVNPRGNNGAGSGDECVRISSDQVNDCSMWLACPAGATGDHGTVACTAPKRD